MSCLPQNNGRHDVLPLVVHDSSCARPSQSQSGMSHHESSRPSCGPARCPSPIMRALGQVSESHHGSSGPGVQVPLWELLSVSVHPGLTACTLPSLPLPFPAPQVMSSTPGFIVSKEKNPTPTLPVPIALSACTSCHFHPNQTGPASAIAGCPCSARCSASC
jgi:hypothetical protein